MVFSMAMSACSLAMAWVGRPKISRDWFCRFGFGDFGSRECGHVIVLHGELQNALQSQDIFWKYPYPFGYGVNLSQKRWGVDTCIYVGYNVKTVEGSVRVVLFFLSLDGSLPGIY